MYETPLVSIITPCYNGKKFVHRFLDSILNQTYPSIELIFVNDGSSDSTEEIVLSYKIRMEKRGIKFIYIFQENKGVGGAINAGLKKVTGKYLCWPDSDDYLEKESIAKRVQVLEENPEYAVVTSDAYIRHVDNLAAPTVLLSKRYPESFKENQFKLLLKAESIFCPGCHMARTDKFMETHPEREIYPAKMGQNWQMLLPLYYRYKRYFLDEPLCNYVQYPSSLSKGDNTKEKNIYRWKKHNKILLEVINSIEMPSVEKKKYLKLVEEIYQRDLLKVGYQYSEPTLFLKHFLSLLKMSRLKLCDLKLLIKFFFNIHKTTTEK